MNDPAHQQVALVTRDNNIARRDMEEDMYKIAVAGLKLTTEN